MTNKNKMRTKLRIIFHNIYRPDFFLIGLSISILSSFLFYRVYNNIAYKGLKTSHIAFSIDESNTKVQQTLLTDLTYKLKELNKITEQEYSTGDTRYTIKTNDLTPKIKIPKRELAKLNNYNLYINNKLFDNNSPFKSYKLRDNGCFKELTPNFLSKPSLFNITFAQNESNRTDYFFQIEYCYEPELYPFLSSLWKQHPPEFIKISKNGLILEHQNTNSIINSALFKRRFGVNFIAEISFSPLGTPLNFVINLSEGRSLFIGDGNNTTITLKFSKNAEDGEVQNFVASKIFFNKRFNPEHVYDIRVVRIDTTFKLFCKNNGTWEKLLSFSDDSNNIIEESEYKSFGLSIWKGGKGVLIKRFSLKGDLPYEDLLEQGYIDTIDL